MDQGDAVSLESLCNGGADLVRRPDSDADAAADSILGGGGTAEVATEVEEPAADAVEETQAAQTETADETENSEAAS